MAVRGPKRPRVVAELQSGKRGAAKEGLCRFESREVTEGPFIKTAAQKF